MAASSSSDVRIFDFFPRDRVCVDISVHQFMAWFRQKRITIPPEQRKLNRPRVTALVERHLQARESYPDYTPLFAGCIVLVEREGVFQLVDGQHRLQALLDLNKKGWNLSDTRITVNYHYGGDDRRKFNMVLAQCGDTFGHVVVAGDTVTATTTRAVSVEEVEAKFSRVADIIGDLYKGCYYGGSSDRASAPYISRDSLKAALKDRKELLTLTPQQIVAIIQRVNKEYEAGIKTSFKDNFSSKLKLMTDRQKQRAAKSGFFLAYTTSNCHWVADIKWEDGA